MNILLSLLLLLVALAAGAKALSTDHTKEIAVTVRLKGGERLGVELSPQLTILSIASGSAASKAALLPGDNITAVQGQTLVITNEEDAVLMFTSALAAARNRGGPIQLTLQRATSEVEVYVFRDRMTPNDNPTLIIEGTLAEESRRSIRLFDCNKSHLRVTLASPLLGCVSPGRGSSLNANAGGVLNGSVVVLLRGECSIETKLFAASAAGVAGVILINDDTGPLFIPDNTVERNGRGREKDLAVVGITKMDGDQLLTLINSREPVQQGKKGHYHSPLIKGEVFTIALFPRHFCAAQALEKQDLQTSIALEERHMRVKLEAALSSSRGIPMQQQKQTLEELNKVTDSSEEVSTENDINFEAECIRLRELRILSPRLFSSQQKRKSLFEQVTKTHSFGV